MTYQEMVDLLRSYRAAHEAVTKIDEKIKELRARHESVKEILYTDMPRGSMKDSDLSDYIAELDELERKLSRAVWEYRREERQVVAIITAVEDPTQQQLLTLRYLLFHTWETVADELGYSYRQVFRIHREAITGLIGKDGIE